MSKSIKFTYDGTDYVLGFNKDTVRQMERAGFRPDLLKEQSVTQITLLFQGAFLKNHKKEKAEKINEIFTHLEDKDELIAALLECYTDPVLAFMDDPAENDSKKVSWKAN